MILMHHIPAMNSQRMLGLSTKRHGKLSEKLSSGYRISRSADDAAGLAISEKMRRQIRGLSQASLNAQDGISLVQTAEGALNELHEIVHRGNELAVKAATGTLSDSDRAMIDEEIQQLKQALDETAEHTVFNEIRLFPDNGMAPGNAFAQIEAHYEISYDLKDGSFRIGSTNPNTGTGTAAVAAVPGSTLSDKIANVLVPNAVAQIFAAFPSLQTAVGGDTIDMAMDISYVDGPNNTLAYAQFSFYSTGDAFNFLLKVDSSDFTDADAEGTGSRAEALESTIAHELMHSVMQYTMTDEMSGRAGEKFPNWFVEGTAQLAGGGFPTGWNNTLDVLADSIADANDASMDSRIADYLDNYSIASRPYGHGYLASAYLGYLKNGGTGDVTADSIADGMNQIFADILGGKSFSQVLADMNLSEAALENMFAGRNAGLVEFVRKLSVAANNGAGSVIAASLADGGTTILGENAPVQQFRIDPDQIHVDMLSGAAGLFFQVGAEAGTHIDMVLFQMNARALGVGDTNVKTQTGADNAINEFKKAIQSISTVRSYMGSIQNRLEHTVSNLDNVVENTTAAESAIRDTDMAAVMVQYSMNNILQQAGHSMLAQANRQPEFILGLLTG